MSVADLTMSAYPYGEGSPCIAKELVGSKTLTGDLSVLNSMRPVLLLDPGGANRNVTFAAEAEVDGRRFHIVNKADAAENLVVKDSGGNTIATINQNESATFWYSGAAWYFFGVNTAALT